MADIFSAVVSVAQCLSPPVAHRINRWRDFKGNFKLLKEKVKDLKAESTTLQNRVDSAKNNGDGIYGDVQTWLETAGNIEMEIQNWLQRAREIIGDDQEAREIRKDEETAAAGDIGDAKILAAAATSREIGEGVQTLAVAAGEIRENEETVAAAGGEIRVDEGKTATKKRCFKGLCSNLKSRYQLSNEAELLRKKVEDHLTNKKSDHISFRTAPEEVWLTSDEGYEAFNSRMSTLTEVQNALAKPNISIVGVYGMGGVGKTTLVKEVARRVKNEKLFAEVVFTEVSQTVDTKKIQQEIAEKLNLELREQSESTRASRLRERLKNEKILVVLDNLWKRLDLETVGIPHGDHHKGCKLLLTARGCKVLSSMGSQKDFSIGVLEEEEGWRLFKKMAGDNVEDCNLTPTAFAVAKACGGLPIAITTIARALKDESVPRWKNALRQLLKPSAENFKGVSGEAYSAIELSYKYLEDEQLEKTFLLCSLMLYPRFTLDLFKYGMWLGIFQGVNTMEDARCKLYDLVGKLKDSCLLLEGDSNQKFFMHDVVRDVAISIACRDQHAFVVRNEDMRKWPNKDSLGKCTAISLIDRSIPELPEGLECPQLEFLYMEIKDSSVEIPENFFTQMRKLRVVDFTGMRLTSLPSSLEVLTNLQTLCLDYGVFGDIAIIGKLKNLEILSFRSSYIAQLPKELSQLTELRLLDLSRCSQLKVIAPHVISSLTRLEELYMSGCSVEWGVEGSASLDELMRLCHLSVLEIDITNENILPEGLLSKKLSSYRISVGNASYFNDEHETLRMLKLELNVRSICLENLQVVKDVEYLCLDKLQGVENVLFKSDTNGLLQLKYLHVQNNPEILRIVDSMERIHAFPLLESLTLCSLINLEKICCDELIAESFNKLNTVKVKLCNKLTNIFSFSTSNHLPRLQKIVVEHCDNMKQIFAIGEENDANNHQVLDKIEFARLTTLKLSNLLQLTCFCKVVKTQENLIADTSKQLFSEKVVLPNLEDLELYDIHVEKIWHNELPVVSSSSFQSITRLIVRKCHKLRYVFPFSVVKCFKQLQHLEIRDCKALEEIIAREGAEGTTSFVFSRVTTLILTELPELRCLYPGMHTSEWPVLETLKVYSCDKMKLFDSELISFDQDRPPLLFVKKAFQKLEELEVNGKDLKMICQNEFPEQFFGKLRFLEVVNDESPSFPLVLLERFHNLEKLGLVESSYKGIFSNGQVKTHVGMLAKIKRLKLSQLNELNHLWETNSKTDSIVQSLEFLRVESCQNLTNLFPSLASFRHLTELHVFNCEKLMNLMTSTTAKSLVQLVSMSVINCSGMTAVVAAEAASEGDVSRDNIIFFSKLKSLYLSNLDSLTSFCLGNCKFKFSCLEFLKVCRCPKMEIFSGGELITPGLKQLQYDDRSERLTLGDLNSDLNKTIQELHQQKLLQEKPIDSIVNCFSQFQHLDRTVGMTLEEIFAWEEGAEATIGFVFPRVTTPKPMNYPNLDECILQDVQQYKSLFQ